MIENGMLRFKLLEHQKEAVEKNDLNFRNHNVSGTVMPTGTGKSFVALAHMISARNPRYHGVDKDGYINIELGQNGVVNDSKIIYVAPNNEIAEQIKIDIVEFILGIDLKKEYENTDKKIDENKYIVNRRNELVKKAFPNLEFVCYKTLADGVIRHKEGRKDGFDPYEAEPDIVIGDEIHRSGAKTFQEGLAALLGGKVTEDGEVVRSNNPEIRKKKKNILLLPISATPERDVDGRDMTKVWAKAFGDYTEEELSDENRADLGLKMTLPDAVNKGILRNPNVVYYDCNLVFTEDYQSLVRQADSKNNDPIIREEAQRALDIIDRDVIGIEGYHKLKPEAQEAALKEKQIEIMVEAIKQGKFNIHGKFVLFAPHTQGEENGTPISRKAFLEKHANITIDIVKEALKRAGVNADIKVDYITSDNADSTNAEILSEFDNEDTTKGPIHIVVAQEKFNEGVHAKNISGGFNTRKITEQQNTNLRAQSILFLQQKGRFDRAIFPNSPLPPVPTIFDVCNNFYIQNVNGAVDPSQQIDIFKLTETQKILHDAASRVRNMIDVNKANIVDILPRLLAISDVLNRYQININYDNVKKSGLLSLLNKSKYAAIKDKVLGELEELKLIDKKGDKYVDYPLGKVLAKARKSYWNGTKEFSKYSFREMIDSGIIDKTSDEYKKAVDKGFIDSRGYVVMNASEDHLFYNVNTGTKYAKDGKDIDGFYDGQFDEETGLDSDGFNKRGFNKDGIHKITKTIHDPNGFMADGKNILTGKDRDLNGFNWDGIKPFYNKNKELVGGFDKEHFYHTYDSDTKKYSRVRVGKYAPYEIKGKKTINVDYYGFDSTSQRNWDNGGALTDQSGFAKDRVYEKNRGYLNSIHPEKAYYDDYGYNIDRFDKHGFNMGFRYCDSVTDLARHKDTGTRLNKNGDSQIMFSSQFTDLDGYLKKQKNDILILTDDKGRKFFSIKSERGKVLLGKTKLSKMYSYMGFTPLGINTHTGLMTDIYGFTLKDYMQDTERNGFRARDVLKLNRLSTGSFAYPTPKYKNPYSTNSFVSNILGTDKAGKMKNGKIHPSLLVAKEFVEKCIKGDMEEKDFLVEYAKKNRLLLYNPVPGRCSEAKYSLRADLTRAFELYRICPELARSDSAKEVMNTIYNSSPEKTNKLLSSYIYNFKNKVTFDYIVLKNAINNIDKPKSPYKAKHRGMLERKMEDAEKLNKIMNDDSGGR